jgi:hypothetical protein
LTKQQIHETLIYRRIKMAKKPMTQKDASRIQSSTAKQNEGKTPPNSFASRAQSTAAKQAQKKP